MITFGKSQPWHSGWKGWQNRVDVFLDGKRIGALDSENQPNKSKMEYTFEDRDERFKSISFSAFGLNAAKAHLRERIEEMLR